MDTTKIKRFATEARRVLLQGVAQRLTTLGFQPDGSTSDEPVAVAGGAVFMGDVVSEDFYNKWRSLQTAVNAKGIKVVAEEAAYTWFNRLVAIRILTKNSLSAPVLAYESQDSRLPMLVSEARQGRAPQMDEQNRAKFNQLLEDDSKTNEQFAMLIVAYCHTTPIINKCFGNIADYTELLLPQNILAENGFVSMLNNSSFISDEDYLSPELIGWLYQFYISEKKDEVFAKKGKFESDEIPAATQIFTPNWIVKYMVQNTVGRIYLDNNPYSDIKGQMNYLVDPSEPTASENKFQFDDIHDLTCADLACGSGHILNECFDILYQIYIEEGYSRRQAIEDIFKYNLSGIDIDLRAKQLATFALLLKACQKDSSFIDAHSMPRVLNMPKPYAKDSLNHEIEEFLMGNDTKVIGEIADAIKLMDNADSLGSIMKFDISEQTRNIISVRLAEYEEQDFVPETIKGLIPYMRIILALTEKYAALVMNPPYMGSGNMNPVLSNYVKKNYAEGKADLATVFVQMMGEKTITNGSYGYIIPPSWMFLSTFEGLRKDIIENHSIQSLLHLSRGVFGADFGSVSCVIKNTKDENAKGTYFRLVERTFQEFEQDHLRILFEQTLNNHDFKYSFKDYSKEVTELPQSDDGNRIYYPGISQKNFEKIPGCPIGYWVSEKIRETFASNRAVSAVCRPAEGLATADTARFLRQWFEVAVSRIGFNYKDAASAADSGRKWFPHNKGGVFRKWYGNQDYVINWENDGYDVKNNKGAVIRNPKLYFTPSVSWSNICSKAISARYFDFGFIYDVSAFSAFTPNYNLLPYLLGLTNSVVVKFIKPLLNPTFHFTPGDFSKIPYKEITDQKIDLLVQQNISISKYDWDAHETSWDFQRNELLAIDEQTYIDNIRHEEERIFKASGEHICIDPAAPQLGSLEWRTEQYKQKWEHLFYQIHSNEEELNRQFIEIYGLQDELTPDVPLDEVTILQQGEISIIPAPGDTSGKQASIQWNDNAIIKQLISYAVGCMMGRYSLDKDGLILANQGDGIDQYNELVPNSRFMIDDDGILPLMSSNSEFTDIATRRFKFWLEVAFGEDSLVENLNFVEKCLGKSIDDYFVKDFWKDHKKMYQNRPIYWLFSSKKGSFQCLVYMHRMNPYTAEKIRTNYLLPHIEWLVSKQAEMQENAANLSTKERKELDNIVKQIDECREYHERLHTIADEQIAFDLDDGIIVNHAKFGDVLTKLK